MDRHFDDPKHLRIKERRLYIRVATDAAGADTVTAFANSEDRANDVNRLQERTAHLALIPEQEVFDQDALDDLWNWAKAEGYDHYDAVDDLSHVASGEIGGPINWRKS